MAKTPHVTAEMTSPAASRLVIRDAFEIKDALKARGYKFDQGTLGWIKSFDAPKTVATEMLHMMDSGYIVVVPGRGTPDRARIAAMVG